MITRLYIDNFKCFSNFEWQAASLQLIVGKNGTGKTGIFDVLETLREFITSGLTALDAFPTDGLTAWDERSDQTFELDVKGNGGQYRYRLVIDHDRQRCQCRVKSEQLTFDQTTLYEFDGKDAHLYRDNGSAGPVFPFGWSRSAISTIPERPDNQRLTWFRNRIEQIYVFSPDPLRMSGRSEGELEKPDRYLHDLVSWIRHLWLQSPDFPTHLRECLCDSVLDGCVDFELQRDSGTWRVLQFVFDFSDQEKGESASRFALSFDQLSEGQRCLVALFTILHSMKDQNITVCIDEPDNYLALREVQPWLVQLSDRVHDAGSQCLLISHHPELINYLAAERGLLFFRDNAGPVRTRPLDWSKDDAVLPSEIVARGWE